MTRLLPLIPVCAALFACSSPGPVAKGARNTVDLPAADKPRPVANASGGPPLNRMQPEAIPPAASEPPPSLPAALLGRWGMTPGDCTSTRGDAKGLLIIEPGGLRFYESRAVPTGDVQTDGHSAAGTFQFTGEGQRWAKYEALRIEKDMLVRTESNPSASFTYARCS